MSLLHPLLQLATRYTVIQSNDTINDKEETNTLSIAFRWILLVLLLVHMRSTMQLHSPTGCLLSNQSARKRLRKSLRNTGKSDILPQKRPLKQVKCSPATWERYWTDTQHLSAMKMLSKSWNLTHHPPISLEPAFGLCSWDDETSSSVDLETNGLQDAFYKATMFVPAFGRRQRTRQSKVPTQLAQDLSDSQGTGETHFGGSNCGGHSCHALAGSGLDEGQWINL